MMWRRAKSRQFNITTTPLQLTKASFPSGSVVKIALATGMTINLPVGAGDMWECTLIFMLPLTSGSHIIKLPAGNVFRGLVGCLDSDLATVNMFGFNAPAGVANNTITLNGTTTGGGPNSVGEWLRFTDIDFNFWHVAGQLSAPAPATPFSIT